MLMFTGANAFLPSPHVRKYSSDTNAGAYDVLILQWKLTLFWLWLMKRVPPMMQFRGSSCRLTQQYPSVWKPFTTVFQPAKIVLGVRTPCLLLFRVYFVQRNALANNLSAVLFEIAAALPL